MKSNYPHILQTPSWGRAKVAAQSSWCWRFFVRFIDKSEFEVVENVSDWKIVKSSVLILERDLPFGQKMLYIPRGPYVDWENENDVNEILELIKSECLKSGAIFVRMEPDVYDSEFPYDWVSKNGFRQTADFVQVRDTVKIDLNKSEDELLNSFHSKHRYNIRLAQKRGLTVRSSTDPKDVSAFYELTRKTDARKEGAMNPHAEEYYQSIVRELGKEGLAKVYIVEKDGTPCSASVVFNFGEESIYMYGASDYEFRRDMPSHLREWVSMTDARNAGCKLFDLWGISMRNDLDEGIKRYKLGYSEDVKKMAGTFDFSNNWAKYNFFNLMNKARRAVGK